MRPRYGRLYAASVMRALGEQLVASLAPRSTDTVCDLLCDGGVLTHLLSQRVARVVATDHDAALAAAAPAEAAAGASVDVVGFAGSRVALADRSCDAAASLLTLGFGDVHALLAETARITRGSIALLVWDEVEPPPHERALRRALAEVGLEPAFLRSVLPALPDPVRAAARRIRDVARFDGPSHLWAALVLERPLAGLVAALPPAAMRAAQHRLGLELRDHTANDGTMRIPVEALVVA